MHRPPPLERLRWHLRRQGLPRGYVNRYVAELSDHWQDLLNEEQTMSTEARPSRIFHRRLGPPRKLAEQAAQQYQRRTFAGRYPVLAFVVAPLPLLALTWIGYLLAALGIVYAIGGCLSLAGVTMPGDAADWPRIAVWAAMLGHSGLIVVPPVLATWLICRWGRRAGRGWGWGLAACLLVALGSAALATHLVLPAAPGTGQFGIGIGLNKIPQPAQVMRFALPLLFAAMLVLRSRRPRQMSLA
jgi:hypothetical protein